MVLFWPIKRGKKSVGHTPIDAATTTSKSLVSLAIETMVHKDEEVIYLYIDTWIHEKQQLSKTLINSGAMLEFISQNVVYDLNLQVCCINEK